MNGRQLLKNFEESSDRVAKLSREVDYMEGRNMWRQAIYDEYTEACKLKTADREALLAYIRKIENLLGSC